MNSIFPEDLMKEPDKQSTPLYYYRETRMRTEMICKPLLAEDYVIQPVDEVSPPKWHLAHSTWFFENFLLKEFIPDYKLFNENYSFLFNSYYESVGNHVLQPKRGNHSRPGVSEIYDYRKYVDSAIEDALTKNLFSDKAYSVLQIGLQHEQQHQELLICDIKFILGNNPIFPAYYNRPLVKKTMENELQKWIQIEEGIYEIGYEGSGFCFDNELTPHKVYLQKFEISNKLVTNAEYIEFINDGGYQNFNYWHSDGWKWKLENNINNPLYWHLKDGKWFKYTLNGIGEIDLLDAVNHVSFYEASAFAQWKNMRLPTEFEWEIASDIFSWGKRWEWTNSAYLPYPGYKKAKGAIGEYNGKFMINQMVLRGASEATTTGHSRKTYRNFFHPHLQWQFSGIRLAK